MEPDQMGPLIRKRLTEPDARVFRQLLDAVPTAMFLVDANARVVGLNLAASQMVGGEARALDNRLCGDVLRCVHARDAKDGCGTGPACPDCAVRAAIKRACLGQPVHRQQAEMRLLRGDDAQALHFLITAIEFRLGEVPFVLLAMEDITELVALRRRQATGPGC